MFFANFIFFQKNEKKNSSSKIDEILSDFWGSKFGVERTILETCREKNAGDKKIIRGREDSNKNIQNLIRGQIL